jgi:hypothetical protein
MSETNKSVIVIDTPDDCLECPLRHQMELISMGNFIYKQVYGCRCQPEDIEDPCIPDVFSKPDWCPLVSLPEKLEELKYSGHCMNQTCTQYEKGFNRCLNKISKGSNS